MKIFSLILAFLLWLMNLLGGAGLNTDAGKEVPDAGAAPAVTTPAPEEEEIVEEKEDTLLPEI